MLKVFLGAGHLSLPSALSSFLTFFDLNCFLEFDYVVVVRANVEELVAESDVYAFVVRNVFY